MIPKLDFLRRINFFYGALGLLVMVEFGAHGSWQSFLEGWLVSVVNFELLKKIGLFLLPQIKTESQTQANPPTPLLYILLVGKFIFWGLVIVFIVYAKSIQPIPFMIGTLTVLMAGLGLGLREFIYART